MKFTFDRDAMIGEVAIAQEIISTKNAGSILSNVFLSAAGNTLTIKATDVKVSFLASVPVQVQEEGSTTVYCDKFMGILAALPAGEVEFVQQADDGGQPQGVVIRPVGKKIKFEMRTMSEEKFPEVAVSEDAPYFEVGAKDLKEMIAQTVFAVSSDETRYFMNGVYFEKKGDKLNMVATDGRRMGFSSKEILAGVPDFPSAIIHPKVLGIVLKHCPDEGNISMAIVDKMVFFKFASYRFGAALIDGQFPAYERVIPASQPNSFTVSKDELVSAMKRVALMVDKKAGRIYFNIEPGLLRITSRQSDLGSADEEIPSSYEGEGTVIAMNYRYIDEPLRVIGADRIAFEFSEEMKAVTMRPEPASHYFHIIMPMQKEA
ncbi:MAG: DNA polymerase III subunit beta [Treponema sp.]|nr:DNA polymerase III subunit beta [Treponema sp.]